MMCHIAFMIVCHDVIASALWEREKMVKKLKNNTLIFGLIFSIASALFILVFGSLFFYDNRLGEYLFNIGVNQLGSLICAALFYGSMKQKGDGTKIFRTLIICSSASFAVNTAISYTLQAPEYCTACFIFCLTSKLIDLVMILCFYEYVNETLNFSGRIKKAADMVIPILMALEAIILLLNIFAPVTFYIDADGMYQSTELSLLEDIYLIVVSVIAVILIIRSKSPRSQKAAALTFIFFPIIEYLITGAMFGNAGQYGIILMSLIIMYCVIFNDKSKKLASTQVELNVATQIQADMLPSIFPAFPRRKEFDIYATMTPAKEVGGDFYDFFLIDDDHLALVMADVSGKGVPAALFMVIAKTLIKNHAQLGEYSPAKVLMSVNEQLCEGNKAELFVTVWLAILEISTGKGKAANAGHEHPALRRKDGMFELVEYRHSPAVATMEGIRFREHDFELYPGDSLFVYTDGVAEATDARNELYGGKRMIDALNKDPDASPEELLPNVKASVDEFVGEAPQFDDLTMLCIKYFGACNDQ